MLISRRRFIETAAVVSLTGPAFARSPAAPHFVRRALDAFRDQARALGVRALVVNAGGRTIVSDGNVAEPLRIASIRKSFLSALYGIAGARGDVKLDTAIGDLGIDDYTSLTAQEKSATVRQLLQARSGIYLPTAAETDAMKAARPARGSHTPGSFWYYNNWDFNVAGELYQRLTGHGLFTAFEHEIARPLGFQDFDPEQHARWAYDRETPRFPAYNLWLSARDMAKFGQLFLARGSHDGRQIVPADWVDTTTRSYSETGRPGLLAGYGYMWWVADPAALPAGTFAAVGNGGRYIVVIPPLQTVVAIQPDEKRGQPPVPLYADKDALDRLIAALVRAAKQA